MTQTAGNFGTWAHRIIPPQLRWALLLTMAITMVYAQTADFEFVHLDDYRNVYENHLVNQFNLAKLKLIWSQPYDALYLPLTYTVWGCLGRLAAWLYPSTNSSQLHPAVFHVANVILHTITVLVVFKILRLLLGKNWPAVFGALLFGLHPLQASTVAWVSGMKQVLSGLLGLLVLWQYLRYAQSDSSPPSQRRLLYLYATALFLAALLAMPSSANVPLVAAVLSCLLLNRPWRKILRELGPWLLLALPLVIITKGLQPSQHLTFTPALWQRFLVAGDSITFYHFKFLWPFNIGPDYGRIPKTVLSAGYIYLTGLLPYLMATLLIWRCRDRWLLAAGLAFIAALSPTLGFIPFQFQDISSVADRYLYVAMLAPALLGGHLLAKYPGRMANTCAVALLLFLALRSADHLQIWQNNITLNEHAIKVNPKSFLAYNNLGVAYGHNKQFPEAIAAFESAIEANPGRSEPYANLGDIYVKQGLADAAKTMFLKSMALQPISDTYLKLADLAFTTGRPLEALTYYEKAVEISPNFGKAYGLGGWLFNELGQKEAAIANYRRAIELDPYLGEFYNNLAVIYLEDNRPAEAIPLLLQAVKLSPDLKDVQRNLAVAYLRLGQPQEAAKWLAQVRSKDPNFSRAVKDVDTNRMITENESFQAEEDF